MWTVQLRTTGDPRCIFPLCLYIESSDIAIYLNPCDVKYLHQPLPSPPLPFHSLSLCYLSSTSISRHLSPLIKLMISSRWQMSRVYSKHTSTHVNICIQCTTIYNAGCVGVCLHVYELCHMIFFFAGEQGFCTLCCFQGFRFMCTFAFIVLYGSLLNVCATLECCCSNVLLWCAMKLRINSIHLDVFLSVYESANLQSLLRWGVDPEFTKRKRKEGRGTRPPFIGLLTPQHECRPLPTTPCCLFRTTTVGSQRTWQGERTATDKNERKKKKRRVERGTSRNVSGSRI